MATQKLHEGPVLPLAIMAMFALMVPVFFIANRNQQIKQTNAAPIRFTVPTNEPHVQFSPIPSSKPNTMMKNNRY